MARRPYKQSLMRSRMPFGRVSQTADSSSARWEGTHARPSNERMVASAIFADTLTPGETQLAALAGSVMVLNARRSQRDFEAGFDRLRRNAYDDGSG